MRPELVIFMQSLLHLSVASGLYIVTSVPADEYQGGISSVIVPEPFGAIVVSGVNSITSSFVEVWVPRTSELDDNWILPTGKSPSRIVIALAF
jgi:hypothetical protein